VLGLAGCAGTPAASASHDDDVAPLARKATAIAPTSASLVVASDCDGGPCFGAVVRVTVLGTGVVREELLGEDVATFSDLPPGYADVELRGGAPGHPVFGHTSIDLSGLATGSVSVPAHDASEGISGVLLDPDCEPARPKEGVTLLAVVSCPDIPSRSVEVDTADGTFAVGELPAARCGVKGTRVGAGSVPGIGPGGSWSSAWVTVTAPATGVRVDVTSRGSPSCGTYLTAREGRVTAKGALPASLVAGVVTSELAKIKDCYADSVRRVGARFRAQVATTFEIAASGAVTRARSTTADVADDALLSCVAARFSGLSFPAVDQGTSATYAVLLAPEPGTLTASAPSRARPGP
jgi:hypothetical protein